MERSERRNLERITSPDGKFIDFEHDSADRIYELEDHQKRKVSYLYDHGGRLVEVRGLRGVRRYEYKSTYLMKIEEDGQRVVEFEYDRQGRIGEVKLPDGRLYRFDYQYDRADSRRVVRSFLTGPDGAVTRFNLGTN
jgi:YD repeat-containing protein